MFCRGAGYVRLFSYICMSFIAFAGLVAGYFMHASQAFALPQPKG